MKSVDLIKAQFNLHKVLELPREEHGALGEPATDAAIFTNTDSSPVVFVSDERNNLYVKTSDGTLLRVNAYLDARTAVIPGATPNQPIHPHVSSPDGSVLELIKDSNGNWRAFVARGDGSGIDEIGLGISSVVDDTESAFDIEYTDVDDKVGLGATEKYSVITGDSDSKGANGLPIIQGSNPADAGANPYPLVVDGGGSAPLGKRQFKRPVVLKQYTGDVSTFDKSAQKGQLCVDDTNGLCYASNSAGDFSANVTAVSEPVGGTLRFAVDADPDTAGHVVVGSRFKVTGTGDANYDIFHTCTAVTTTYIEASGTFTATGTGTAYNCAVCKKASDNTVI